MKLSQAMETSTITLLTLSTGRMSEDVDDSEAY